MAMRRTATTRARTQPLPDVPKRVLQVSLPNYLVAEVHRAAQIRSRIERTHVSADLLVTRALIEHLWLDPDEMRAGHMVLPEVAVVTPPSAYTSPRPPLPPPQKFGTLLRSLRQQKRLSVAALARALNMSPHHFYEVERGIRTPLTETQIRCVAQLLDSDDPDPIRVRLLSAVITQ
jgi:hypothetical protein